MGLCWYWRWRYQIIAIMSLSKNILIIRVGALGDNIIIKPILENIRKKYENDKIIWLSSSGVFEVGKIIRPSILYSGTNLIDEFYELDDLDIYSKIKFLFYLMKTPFSKIYYIMPVRSFFQLVRDHLFIRLFSWAEIVGLKYNRNCNMRLPIKNSFYYEHELDRIIRILSADAGVIGPTSNQIFDDLKINFQRSKVGKIAICPGGKYLSKKWPIRYWRELVDDLRDIFPNCTEVGFYGSGDERELIEDIIKSSVIPCRNNAGRLNIKESFESIENSDFYIGGDTGLTHFAASCFIPMIGIYSGINKAGEWYPYGFSSAVAVFETECRGCGLIECNIGHPCMIYLTPTLVVNKIIQLYKY